MGAGFVSSWCHVRKVLVTAAFLRRLCLSPFHLLPNKGSMPCFVPIIDWKHVLLNKYVWEVHVKRLFFFFKVILGLLLFFLWNFDNFCIWEEVLSVLLRTIFCSCKWYMALLRSSKYGFVAQFHFPCCNFS